ncbi:Putative transferase, LIC12162 family [Candidatus Methylopumilus planktonicus]
MDAIVAEPYGLDLGLRKNNHEHLKVFRENFFREIYPIFNRLHNVNYDERFWLILMGDWMTRYVDVIYNRVKTLENCIERYEISEISIVSNNKYIFAACNSYDALESFNDENWNDYLLASIVKVYFLHLRIYEIEDHSPGNFEPANKIEPKSIKFILKKILYNLNSILFNLFGKDTDGLIISSYLPFFSELKLQLKFKQFPAYWRLGRKDFFKPASKFNFKQRSILSFEILKDKASSSAETLTRELFFLIVPVAFIEGFNDLIVEATNLPWPKRPKFIFTSNNYDFDEPFKAYVALKIHNNKSMYYIGCHGSGFYNFFENPLNAEVVCDKYITWGWFHGSQKHKRGFIFTSLNKKATYDKNGVLLFIQHPLFNRACTWDVYADHDIYFNKQQKFVGLLPSNIKSKVIIRLHHTSYLRGWHEKEKWIDYLSVDSYKIDEGRTKFEELSKKARLLVFSYDSTGFAEAMAQNVPALLFFQIDFLQLNSYAKPYYQFLVDVEIAHSSPETLAKKVNEIWSNIDLWWTQDYVQKARVNFCDNYARNIERPLDLLRSTFNE